MKIKFKLILWFLIIASLIGVSSVIAFAVVSDNIRKIVEVENPKVQAVLEMEINVDELGRDVLDYLKTENIQILDEISDSRQDYLRWHQTYESLITSDEEKDLLNDMDIIFTKYDEEASELIDIKKEQVLILQELRILINEKFDPGIDELQKELVRSDANFAQKQEALLEMEINTFELVSSVRDYVLKSDDFNKNKIKDSVEDYQYWETQFKDLTQTEQILMEEISANFKDVNSFSFQIIDLEDEKNKLLLELKENSVALDYILDEQLQTIAIKNIQDEETLVLNIINTATVSILFSFIFVIILGIFVSTKLSRPISKLQHATDEFAKGNYNVKSNVRTDDEIGTLAVRFDSMVKDVNEARLKALHSERLSAIGELSASMSHDIRNPLSTIKNSNTSIKKVLHDEGALIESQRIDRSIARITHQINQVLDFVKITPINLEKLSITSVLERTIKNMEIPPNISINLPKDDFEIWLDSSKMESTFYNIIFNAVQAIESQKGTITITTSEEGDMIKLDFENDGPNIPDEEIHKIFDPLFTTKQKGTGLGLSSVKNSVEQHKGTISVTNNPVVFTIKLPKKKHQI